MVGRDDAPVERDPVVGSRDQRRVEEREADLVAGAVDRQVDLLLAAVDEADRPAARERVDVRLHGDVAVADPRQQVGGDRRVRLDELVVGLREAEVLRMAGGELEHAPVEQPQQRQRQPGGERVAELVRGLALEVLGDDPGPATHRQEGRVGVARALDRDVGGGVADPEHQHALAVEDVGLAVVVGVQLLAGELVLAGKRGLGPARRPSDGRWRPSRRRTRPIPARRRVARRPASGRRRARPGSPRSLKRIRSRRPK